VTSQDVATTPAFRGLGRLPELSLTRRAQPPEILDHARGDAIHVRDFVSAKNESIAFAGAALSSAAGTSRTVGKEDHESNSSSRRRSYAFGHSDLLQLKSIFGSAHAAE
jgi:hypothetical protein